MRITALAAVVAAAVFAAVTASPVAAQTPLKMNISVGQNSHYGVAIDTFAREIEKRTNGRYTIQNFYAGALGAERESIEGVQLGTLDLTMTSTGPVPNFVPEVAILDIPFLFRDYAHARAVLDGPIGQELLTKFEAKGMVGLDPLDDDDTKLVHDLIRRHRAAAAGLVLDDELLAHCPGQPLRHHPGCQVGGGARTEADNDPHWPGWVVTFRRGRGRQAHDQKQTKT